jgi:hypothetical protein
MKLRCSYCGKIMPKDVTKIVAHVTTCESNICPNTHKKCVRTQECAVTDPESIAAGNTCIGEE